MDKQLAEDYFKLLKQQPIFSLWSQDLISQFIPLLKPLSFTAGEIIVHEGDVIDAIYFIVEGKAEVSRHEAKDPTKQLILATFQTGDNIGLNDTSLYSTTGVRSATVIALTDIMVLTINIDYLHEFLAQHPQLNTVLELATAQQLKLNLIKQAAPFSVLTFDEISNLTNKIEVINFPKNTLIFKQGDSGNYCYIIDVGQIAIKRIENEIAKEIAVLSKTDVFGETAILMDLPRSASAIAVTDVKLFSLHRDDLLALTEKEKKSKQAFSEMMLERSQPNRVANISEHQQINDEGEFIVILKNAATYEYYQLSNEGWLIWQQINGVRTIKEIIMVLMTQYHIFSPTMVNDLICDLVHSGFVELNGYRFIQDDKLPIWISVMDKIKMVMEYEKPFPHVDHWINKIYQKYVKVFYTVPSYIAMLLISIIGLISFAIFSHHEVQLLPHTSHLIFMIILVDIAGIISVPLHELAHAFTTKHFKREVIHFGIGWYWIGPMAFTDTSDMWLSTKWPRIWVNLAGVCVDFVVAGIFALMAILIPSQSIALFCWLFSIYIYLSIYYNLYPLIELDGYYVLMDLFSRPHLREDAVQWLVEIVPKIFKQPVFTREYKYEMLYWLICLIFIILSPLIAWFVQHFILAAIFPGLKYGCWRWLLPSIAIVLSLLSVWIEIHKQRRLH